MTRNGRHRPLRPQIEMRQAASSEEAAAIAAAIEQFMHDTAPAPEAPRPAITPWARAGLYDQAGVDNTEAPWTI